ncbi:hypothetical protein [Rhodococcus sp. SGAir0479]|nr:hypothetical protein [Rhodococcus sp. SGAir0479]
MSVSFLQATAAFFQGLAQAIYSGSVTPGTGAALGSLADVISES